MSDNSADNRSFDQYLFEHGGWAYDNSWRYEGKGYFCFVRNEHLDADGRINSLILLQDCPEKFQAIVIHLKSGTQTEVWAGPFRTMSDIDALQRYFEGWDQHNEPPQ